MQEKLALTPLRETIVWNGKTFVGACDLIRPINRRILHPIGVLDEETSNRILATFQRMLAKESE